MDNSTKRNVTLAAALLVVLGGAAAWWFWPRSAALPDVRPSADNAALPLGPGVALKIAAGGKLDEATLEDFRKRMLQDRIDSMRAYSKMTPQEKKKKLDEDIDNFEKVRKNMPATLPTSLPADGKPDVKIEGDQNNRRVTVRIGGSAGPKSAMEDLPPDVRAILSQYQKDLRDRRAERGLPDAPGGMVIIRSQTSTK